MVFKIAGVFHHKFTFPSEGDLVFAIPEPTNKFDPEAVAIYNVQHQKMGYAPQKEGRNKRVKRFLENENPKIFEVVLVNQNHGIILVEVSVLIDNKKTNLYPIE